jgi:hypothetical protein
MKVERVLKNNNDNFNNNNNKQTNKQTTTIFTLQNPHATVQSSAVFDA